MAAFLEDPVKFKVSDWEPRYLLNPVGYEKQEVVSKTTGQPAAKQETPKTETAPAPKSDTKKATPTKKASG